MVLLRRLATRSSTPRTISSCLRWPLEEGTTFSSRLHEIEQHWRSHLAKTPRTTAGRAKKYVLAMFPYPSGHLHMGHMRVYTISDVLARYYRLNGFDVLHPIGWDAFGLPAENAAFERNVDPREWTDSNIATMREQLKCTGIEFDWSREICTCSPSYFHWTQWLFLRLFERGLVRRGLAEVFYDPVDATVLAAEQIDGEGRSWRSGALAEKRKLRQWMVDTPRYAKRLRDGLERLREWRDWGEVADIQANWIGACDVVRFHLAVKMGQEFLEEGLDLRIAKPAQLATARFLLVTLDHPLVTDDMRRRIGDRPGRSGLTASNFVTGHEMPIVIVPRSYVDEQFVLNAKLATVEIARELDESSGETSNRQSPNPALSDEDVQRIAESGGHGGYLTSRRLLDWVVSRQRRWGTPIPMLLSGDKQQTPIALDASDLPLQAASIQADGLGECLPGYGNARRDPDTLDTFFDSSWYYLRYLDCNNQTAIVAKEIAQRMMPVDVYVGGIEHADVHLFFARFMSYFLYDIGVTSCEEPFDRLLPQGIVRGRTFIHPESGKYVRAGDVREEKGGVFVDSRDGAHLLTSYEKMSKSKHNGVDPLDALRRDGIDLTRLQLLDNAAPRSPINWGETDAKGLRKFLDRVAWIVTAYVRERNACGDHVGEIDPALDEFYRENYNYFVRSVSILLEVLHVHNTAIARLQGLTNALRVFAPSAASEFWTALASVPAIPGGAMRSAGETDVGSQPWPLVDDDAAIDFNLLAQGINVGRLSVDRRLLEPRDADALMRLAVDEHHPAFFRCLADRGHRVLAFAKKMRPGLYVTLELQLDVVDVSVVSQILEQLRRIGVKQKTVRKKKPDGKAKPDG